MPISDSAEILRSAILFIANNQNQDGGFASLTQVKEKTIVHHTIFFPALIGTVLAPIKNHEVNEIIKNINYFLRLNQGETGLWSYWAKGDSNAVHLPYPPDLDDSSLAVALQSIGNELDSGTLVNFIQALIANETKPGGPYRTWVTGSEAPDWSDIDPVVNASVIYALKQQKIILKTLNNFLVEKIRENHWVSPYYISKPLMLFLIDRALEGQTDNVNLVKELFENELPEQNAISLLDTALCLLLMIRTGADDHKIINEFDKVMTLCHTQSYTDDPCILERKNGSYTEVSGCKSLTAAAVALAIFQFVKYKNKAVQPPKKMSATDQIHDEVVTRVAYKLNTLDAELFSVGLGEFGKLIASPISREITCISYDIGSALEANTSSELYIDLGCANLWGWLTYQLYDGCYDEGEISPDLSLANICLREAARLYHEVSRKYKVPPDIVINNLDSIDLAHAYELKEKNDFAKSCTAKEWLGNLKIDLCQRSFGHYLGPQLIAWISRQTPETRRYLNNLFTHYLNTRQMCDDLHDWHDDFAARRLTSVTKPLFLSRYAFPLSNNETNAAKIFWQEGIAVAVQQAKKELQQAEMCFKKISWKQTPTILSGSLEKLKSALEEASYEHATMRTLIKKFN